MPFQDALQLRALPIFSALPEASTRFLQDRMHKVEYPAGVMILRPGVRCDYMAIVVSGKVQLRTQNGRVQTIGRGGVFGQAMMRYAVPSAYCAETLTPTTLWMINRSEWLAANYMSWETAERPVSRREETATGGGAISRTAWRILSASLALWVMAAMIGPVALGWLDLTFVRLSLQSQHPALAESYLKLALRRQPDSAALRDALGYVLHLQSEPDLATKEFDRAIELEPELASAHNNLGVALLARGLEKDALPHLQASVELAPGNAEALVNLGNAFLAAGDSQEAMNAYQRAISLDAAPANAQANWAILALKDGRIVEARQAFQKAARADPRLALARQGLGVIALLEGEAEAALTELEAARQLEPKNVATHLYLGVALKNLGRPLDAAVEFIQVLSNSQNPEYLNLARKYLGEVYSQLMPGEITEKGGSSSINR